MSLKLSLEYPHGEGNFSGKTGAKIVPRQFLPRGNQMSHWALWEPPVRGVSHKSENCSKITCDNILSKSFREVSANLFGKFAHIFGKLVHIFARKLVSRTSKQVSRNLGPLWQPGVYNDTITRASTTIAELIGERLIFCCQVTKQSYMQYSPADYSHNNFVGHRMHLDSKSITNRHILF